MSNDNVLDRQMERALSEFQALEGNGEVDPRAYVELHNRYPPDVQAQLRFFALVSSMQQTRRVGETVREQTGAMKKIRADIDAARISGSGSALLAVLAIAVVLGVDVTGAVAAAAISGIVAYFIQLGLAALLYKREQA